MTEPAEAFVPGCEYDIFLSYAWDDNKWPVPPKDLADGWVHQFRETLRVYLNQKLRRHGGRVKFFFDTYSIRQQQDFQTQVDAGVSRSAVMVTLVSDAWLGSGACQVEIALFDRNLQGEANQSGRLFPVHLEQTVDWPHTIAEILNRVKGYDCYLVDSAEQISRRHRLGTEDFVRSLSVLRERIAEQLIELRKKRTGASTATQASSSSGTSSAAALTIPDQNSIATIYLAEAVGMKRVREELEAYFRSARIRVLPERPYSRDPASFRESLRADLEQSSVFVQVFGATASTRTDKLPRGYEGLQLDVAEQLGRPVIQWRDARVDRDDVDEPDYAEMAFKATYFGELIEFSQAVREKIDRLVRAGPPPDSAKACEQWALIKADPVDDKFAGTLAGFLAEHDIGCEVVPNGLATLKRLREHGFDAVMLVYGSCPEQWIEKEKKDLRAVLLDRRDQAPVCGFYLDRPRTPPLVVKGIQNVVHQDQTLLLSLVTAIRNRRAER